MQISWQIKISSSTILTLEQFKKYRSRAAEVKINFRAGSTFPVPVCTIPSSMDRTSRCNKVDVVRLYDLYKLNLLLLKGRFACVVNSVYHSLIEARETRNTTVLERCLQNWLFSQNSKILFDIWQGMLLRWELCKFWDKTLFKLYISML